MRLSQEHIKLWKAIHKIMWEEWDPIGVSKFGDWPDDEYNGYVPQIFQLKIQGADAETVAQTLFKYESYIMGMPRSIENCRAIADKIISI